MADPMTYIPPEQMASFPMTYLAPDAIAFLPNGTIIPNGSDTLVKTNVESPVVQAPPAQVQEAPNRRVSLTYGGGMPVSHVIQTTNPAATSCHSTTAAASPRYSQAAYGGAPITAYAPMSTGSYGPPVLPYGATTTPGYPYPYGASSRASITKYGTISSGPSVSTSAQSSDGTLKYGSSGTPSRRTSRNSLGSPISMPTTHYSPPVTAPTMHHGSSVTGQVQPQHHGSSVTGQVQPQHHGSSAKSVVQPPHHGAMQPQLHASSFTGAVQPQHHANSVTGSLPPPNFGPSITGTVGHGLPGMCPVPPSHYGSQAVPPFYHGPPMALPVPTTPYGHPVPSALPPMHYGPPVTAPTNMSYAPPMAYAPTGPPRRASLPHMSYGGMNYNLAF